ncbi:MAG TPA: hypothetical protein VHS80_08230 [Chthoniobacterales bacterium]|nr:hypothetical protein [Chthoniobacterales bacterium]
MNSQISTVIGVPSSGPIRTSPGFGGFVYGKAYNRYSGAVLVVSISFALRPVN